MTERPKVGDRLPGGIVITEVIQVGPGRVHVVGVDDRGWGQLVSLTYGDTPLTTWGTGDIPVPHPR